MSLQELENSFERLRARVRGSCNITGGKKRGSMRNSQELTTSCKWHRKKATGFSKSFDLCERLIRSSNNGFRTRFDLFTKIGKRIESSFDSHDKRFKGFDLSRGKAHHRKKKSSMRNLQRFASTYKPYRKGPRVLRHCSGMK